MRKLFLASSLFTLACGQGSGSLDAPANAGAAGQSEPDAGEGGQAEAGAAGAAGAAGQEVGRAGQPSEAAGAAGTAGWAEPGGAAGAAGAEPCAPGLVRCGGDCIDPTSDLQYCGAGPDCSNEPGRDCAAAHNALASCVSGACQITCLEGYADCNADPTDGCETLGSCPGAACAYQQAEHPHFTAPQRDLVLCGGSYTPETLSSACGTGWHVCSESEWNARAAPGRAPAGRTSSFGAWQKARCSQWEAGRPDTAQPWSGTDDVCAPNPIRSFHPSASARALLADDGVTVLVGNGNSSAFDTVFAPLDPGNSAGLAVYCCAETQSRPNVVLILADDLGQETLNSYGGLSYSTRNLTRMANAGWQVQGAHAQPLCTPSRVQVLTGRFNQHNYESFGKLTPGETTIAHLFQSQGYATLAAGKWQLTVGQDGERGQTPTEAGFDEYCLWWLETRESRYWAPTLNTNGVEETFGSDVFGPDVIYDCVRDFITRHADQPFFVYYPLLLPHAPLVETPTSRGAATLQAQFTGMVEYIDYLVGQLRSEIASLGLASNTVLLFVGDNGTDTSITSQTVSGPVVGGKGTRIDSATRVPFLVQWQGAIDSASVSEEMLDLSVVLPTVAEAARIPLDPELPLDGRSLVPAMLGLVPTPRDWVYIWYESRRADGNDVWVFARDRRYKLYTTGEFFDLVSDPLELEPLPADGPAARSSARARLQQILESDGHPPFE